MVMPGFPRRRRTSAHNDHPNAASVPTEMRVSMVAAPWRRLAHAARWNGSAPHTTTGAANVSDSHCQLLNCRAGIMAMASTGRVEQRRDDQPVAQRVASRSTSTASDRCPAAFGTGRGQGGGVAGRLDRGDEVGGVDVGGEVDLGPLGGEVDRGGDAVEAVEALLDAHGAAGAGHATDAQLHLPACLLGAGDVSFGRSHELTS